MHDSHSPKGVLSKEFGKSGRCKVLPTHHMQKGKEEVGGGEERSKREGGREWEGGKRKGVCSAVVNTAQHILA